jgi:predicted  nucleic acid-binding Zn-ribbon protein
MSKRIDLDRLRRRAAEKPRTKAGQIRQAWQEIKELQAAGHSLRDIREWLKDIGVEIGYCNLSQCLSRLRRRERTTESQIQELLSHLTVIKQEQPRQEQPRQDQPASPAEPLGDKSDPLRNLREQRARKKSFEFDPFPTKGLTR